MSEALAVSNAWSQDWHHPKHTFKLDFDPSREIDYKVRFLIVVKVLPALYQAVPIFTKCGNGIANVPESEHSNYMPIRDHRSGLVEMQNMEMPLLETEEMDAEVRMLHPKSIVMYTGPTTMWAKHEIDIVGRLTSHSTAVLLQHYHRVPGEVICDPSTEMIEKLERNLQTAKAAQREFNDALLLDPNHGKKGNKQPTNSPPSQYLRRHTRNRSASASDVLDRIKKAMGTQPNETPSQTLFTNTFSALAMTGDEQKED